MDFMTLVSGEAIPHVANIAVFFFLLIFGVAGFGEWWFGTQIASVRKALTDALSEIKSCEGTLSASALQKLNTNFKGNELISHPWKEFYDSIIQWEGANVDEVFKTKPAEEFFTEEVLIRQNIHVGLYEALPGSLTALGLIGTFVAIYIALTQLNFQSGQVSDISPFVNTLGGKFLASIFGLVAALFTLVRERLRMEQLTRLRHQLCVQLNQKIPQNQPSEKFFQNLASDLSTKLASGLSKSILAVKDHVPSAGEFKTQTSSISAKLSRVEIQLSGLNLKIQALEGSNERLCEATERAYDRRDELLRDMIVQVAYDFRKALLDAANEEIEALARELGNLLAGVNKLDSSMLEVNHNFEGLLSAQREQLESLLTYQTEQSDLIIKKQENQFATLSDQIGKNLDGLLLSTANQLKEHVKILSSALNHLSEEQEARSQQIHTEQVDRVQTLLLRLENSIQASNGIAENTTQIVGSWIQSVRAEVDKIVGLTLSEANTLTKASEDFDKIQMTLASVLEANTKTLSEMENVGKLINRAAQALSTNDIAMRKSAEQQQQAMALFDSQIKAYKSLTEMQISVWNDQKSGLEKLDDSLAKASTSLSKIARDSLELSTKVSSQA